MLPLIRDNLPQNLVLNLNKILYRDRCTSYANCFDRKVSRKNQSPYVNNKQYTECQVTGPITEILHRDCIICHLEKKAENINKSSKITQNKTATFIIAVGSIVTVLSALVAFTKFFSIIVTVIPAPICILLLVAFAGFGLSCIARGGFVLAKQLLPNKDNELDCIVLIHDFLRGVLEHIDVPNATAGSLVLQTNKRQLDKLITAPDCLVSAYHLQKEYNKLQSLESLNKQLQAQIAAEANDSTIQAKYIEKLGKNTSLIKEHCEHVTKMSRRLFSKIFAGIEAMCHEDYKANVATIKQNYIEELSAGEASSVALFASIFMIDANDPEAMRQFKNSKFFATILTGVNLLKQTIN